MKYNKTLEKLSGKKVFSNWCRINTEWRKYLLMSVWSIGNDGRERKHLDFIIKYCILTLRVVLYILSFKSEKIHISSTIEFFPWLKTTITTTTTTTTKHATHSASSLTHNTNTTHNIRDADHDDEEEIKRRCYSSRNIIIICSNKR